ncbi:MAG TPA: DinB family protein [Vicinamibacterales bacterium]|nr:DinB family protein [Vicinamibacterales bacterium]
MTQTSTTQSHASALAGRRADALADRLEQGARALADFAASLTDAQWKTRCMPDGRTVGVIVHHVGFVYPIEIDISRPLAKGEPLTGVTMDDVHAMNAKHAIDYADVTKQQAIELVRSNSAAAAAAIRALSDEQLTQAAPASLYADAPVTCQFILEDHAVRHSYHHLARLRRAVQG